MPDPIEELENFSIPGPAMTPLPAAEVRRRGTRMRRRNNALATAGALAVVAAIATPFALFAGQQSPSEPDPAPSITWRQEIPQDFPLAKDMFGNPDVTGKSGVGDVELCGATAWSPSDPVTTVDLAGAHYAADGESQQGRTLALYADDQAASQALASIRTAVEDCPRDDNDGGLPLINEAIPADLGGDSFAFIQRARDGDLMSQLSVWEVVRSGNALYLDFSYGSAGDDQAVATAVSLMANRSEAVRGDLCVFSPDGCGASDQAEDPSAGGAASIPAGFELLDGLPTEGATKDFGRSEPGAALDPVDLSVCGRTVPAADTVDDRRADFTDPAGLKQRHLMLFPDEGAAETWLVTASRGYIGCEVDGGNGVVRLYDVQESPLGDSARTAVGRHYVDGEPGAGYEIVEFVRVGPAVVVAKTTVDGDSEIVTDERAANLVATSRSELSPVVDAMCVLAGSC